MKYESNLRYGVAYTRRCVVRKLVLGLFAFFGVCVPRLPAGILFGTDGFTGDLVRIDTATGASTVVGTMGTGGTGLGLAVNGMTGIAYSRNFNQLFTVNLGTAATTLVGSSGNGITALAFDPTYTTLYSVNQSSGQLFRINPATGAVTLVGNTGITTPLGLSTNSAGILYGASISGGLYSINTTTGAATLLYSSVSSDGLTAISFDETDTLYGITLGSDHLVRINLLTGTSIMIGGPNVRQDIRGLDYVRSENNPEPISIIVFGGVLAIGGWAARRHGKPRM